MNDGISTSDSSMVYASIEDTACFITTLGRGSLLAKTDIDNAFRLLPVHLSDQQLLGMHWEGQLFHRPAVAIQFAVSSSLVRCVC